MEYTAINWEDLNVTADLSYFESENGTTEGHVMFRIKDPSAGTEDQFKSLETAVERISRFGKLQNTQPIWKRYFVSDAVNQVHLLNKEEKAAVSIVQQPPLDGSKVALWVYYVTGYDLSLDPDGTRVMQNTSYRHLYNTQLHLPEKNEFKETQFIFDRYCKILNHHGGNLKNNCIRTWIYVQGVDIHYKGMVEARKEYFRRENLTENTHYIASTGIEGKFTDPNVLVLMDAYGIEGIHRKQINYLKAPTHLNPTSEYGVTFERGTTVDYGDRRHIFISGTASIDNKGNIVHPYDIGKQTERTLENIRTLLVEAEADWSDVAQLIIYLRDTGDALQVSQYLESVCPSLPRVMVWAPVCRPGWLIEMECIAIKKITENLYASF